MDLKFEKNVMKKENVCFPIEDEKEIKKVESLLKNYNQKIDFLGFDFYYGENNFLYFEKETNHWFMNGSDLNREKITFDDLKDMLKIEGSLCTETREDTPNELFKKPFRRGHARKDIILDANGCKVFKLNQGQYSDDLINKILNSINN